MYLQTEHYRITHKKQSDVSMKVMHYYKDKILYEGGAKIHERRWEERRGGGGGVGILDICD